jgi:hypothetical protein
MFLQMRMNPMGCCTWCTAVAIRAPLSLYIRTKSNISKNVLILNAISAGGNEIWKSIVSGKIGYEIEYV